MAGSLLRRGGLAVIAGALALCAMLLFGARPAYATEVAGDGWTLDDNGVLTLMADIEDIDGLNSGQNYEWAQYADKIQEVVVAEGVTKVPLGAFNKTLATYGNLHSFTASSTLKSIGNVAFSGVSSLTEITLNDGLEDLGTATFASTGITEVVIPDNVAMGSDVFTYCTSLTRATIGGGATWYGNAQFYGCTSLESVRMEEGTVDIPDQFLGGCTNLKYFWIPRSITGFWTSGYHVDVNTVSDWLLVNSTGCVIGYKGSFAEKYVERWDGKHGNPGSWPITFHAIDGDAHEGSWQTVSKPTCTTAGQEQLACDICGTTQTREMAATGHSWDAGVVTTESTATTEGVRTFTCTACGAAKTEAIPALGSSEGQSQASGTNAASGEQSGKLAQTGDNALSLIAALAFSLMFLSAGALALSAGRNRS